MSRHLSRSDSSRYYDDPSSYRTRRSSRDRGDSRRIHRGGDDYMDHDGGVDNLSSGSGMRNSPHYSHYYRTRFGSHSPEEYKNLRLTNMDPAFSDEELRRALEKEFKRFGDLQVKLVRGPNSEHDRIAYVNFEQPGVAKEARQGCLVRLRDLIGRGVRVDPAGVIKDQSGRFLLPRDRDGVGNYGGGSSGGRRSISPPPSRFGTSRGSDQRRRSNSPPPYRGGGGALRSRVDDNRMRRDLSPRGGRSPPARYSNLERDRGGDVDPSEPRRHSSQQHFEPQDELDETPNATRTLYVGNLDPAVDDSELRAIFEKYGVLEDIDVKRQSVHAFAFVRFQNLDMAMSAKASEIGSYVRGHRFHVGYGKPLPSRRLWVGGLGPWISLDELASELDRYGVVEKLDFVKGENHAYVLFGSVEAAAEACQALKGFPLGGPERRIRVDFAADELSSSGTRDNGVLPSGPDKNGVRKRSRTPTSKKSGRDQTVSQNTTVISPHERESSSSKRQRTNNNNSSEILQLLSTEDLLRHFGECWTGVLVLKRSAYPIRLVRLKGDAALVDAFIRDPSGQSVQLTVSQRLKLDQPKQEDVEKWCGSPDHCFLLALPGGEEIPKGSGGNLEGIQTRSLRLLVKYFKEKEAAGVINLTSSQDIEELGVLYAFPQCEFAENLLKSAAPVAHPAMKTCGDELLLIVLIRGAA